MSYAAAGRDDRRTAAASDNDDDDVTRPEAGHARLPAGVTGPQADEMRKMLSQMPADDVLAGLRFAYSRWLAKNAGELKVGRKSVIRREVHTVSAEQARWRLENWKVMIAEYRRKGYSYPTISRIKKLLAECAESEPQ